MKKILSLSVLLVTVLLATAQKPVINDPNAETRALSGSFNGIRVSHAIDLYLTQGDTEGIAVSASKEEYRDKIKTFIENGVLKITYDNEDKFWKNGSNRKLKAYVSFKTLNLLQASGASDVKVNGSLDANDLTLDFSGASDFDGSITAKSLTIDLSGASHIKVSSGKVNNLKVDARGASDFIGYDLVTENCTAEASGASGIQVTVNNELNVVATGASDVRYKGEGKIKDLKTSGASSVSRKS